MVAPDSNPGMLEIIRDRDRTPPRDMVPWAGEFAGKYLTGAVQVLRVTGDPVLRDYLITFVSEFISLQDTDGYLGPWPRDCHLTNHVPHAPHDTWDTWGHYHAMLGLILWYETTGEIDALACAERVGDLLCEKYLGDKSPRLVQTGSTEMNLAPAHSLCLLYNITGKEDYLRLARQIVDNEFGERDGTGAPLAGDWLNTALDGLEFYETPKPRWESLHPIMAMAELYHITNEDKYRQAFEHIWWSIRNLDRHNNGGFSSGEQAQGNPYHQGAIETCCTIAWTAMSVEMMRLTGDCLVADDLELTLFNSIIGMHSFTGRWATYNTPMDGVRRASAHDIVFQSREGTPELNCCSVNSARGFGMISDWALMGDSEGLVLNWYGPGTLQTRLDSGVTVKLLQETTYPRDGHIALRVAPDVTESFTLKLRIPAWSAETRVAVNGEQVDHVTPGTYLSLTRTWQLGDTIEIGLDMSLHSWTGEQECAGKTSIYRGPLLLTYDRRFNTLDPDQIPKLDASRLDGRVVHWPGRMQPVLLMEFTGSEGQPLRLVDFGSAGEGGTPYLSWLTVNSEGNALPEYFSPIKRSSQ